LHSSNQQYEAASSKNLAKKAETIENTRKTVDILIGATCHNDQAINITVGRLFFYSCFSAVGGVETHRFTFGRRPQPALSFCPFIR
jgi:hypothetical protein